MRLEYTMRDDGAAVLDASTDGEPLVFTQREQQIIEVPRETIPADAQSTGQPLVARSPDGSTRVVRVKEVREGTVLLDLNHPLAGMTLHIAVRVIGIDGPTAR